MLQGDQVPLGRDGLRLGCGYLVQAAIHAGPEEELWWGQLALGWPNLTMS